MKEKKRIAFRRVRGRIIPIRIDNEQFKGGAKVALGAGVAYQAGAAKVFSDAFLKSGERIAAKRIAEGAPIEVVKHARFLGQSLSKFGLAVAGAALVAGSTLIASGTKDIVSKKTRKKFEPYIPIAATLGSVGIGALALHKITGQGKRKSYQQLLSLVKKIK